MCIISLIIPPSNYDPEFGYKSFVNTPLEGITSLRAALLREGHTVNVLDLRCRESPLEWLEKVIDRNCHLIGFTTFFDSFAFVEKAIKRLRFMANEAVYIVGGPLASGAPDSFLRYAKADAVVRGEGEKALVELAARFPQDLKEFAVPGVLVLDSQGNMLDTGHATPYHSLDEARPLDWSYARDQAGRFSFLYSTSRGCDNNCAYCCKVMGPKRFKPIEMVEKDLKQLREVWGMRSFIFNDTDFLHNNPFLQDYLNILSTLDLRWGCFATPKSLSESLLNRLVDCGCANLRVGVETFDDHVLHINRRPVGRDEMLANLDILEASNIAMITCYLLLGLPGQTKDSLENTLDQIRKRKRFTPRPFILIPLPGSAIYQKAIEEGKIIELPYLRLLADVSMQSAHELSYGLNSVPTDFIQQIFDELTKIKKERLNQYDIEITV